MVDKPLKLNYCATNPHAGWEEVSEIIKFTDFSYHLHKVDKYKVTRVCSHCRAHFECVESSYGDLHARFLEKQNKILRDELERYKATKLP